MLRAYNGYPQHSNFRQVTIGRTRSWPTGDLSAFISQKKRGDMAEPTYEELKAKLAQL
jgi:hypothetical protein